MKTPPEAAVQATAGGGFDRTQPSITDGGARASRITYYL
jgi:hypothetical protein